VFTKSLPSNDKGDTQTHKLVGWIYKYAVEMGSSATIYIPSFIKTDSGIQKLIAGDTQTHRWQGDLISLLLFFQIRNVD
jgi:hypothetical protein